MLAGSLIASVVSAALALAWARLSRTPWREIGYARPRSGFRVVAIGVAFGVGLKLLMKAVVMPLLGAPPTNQAYAYLVGNPAGALLFVPYVIVGAGFAEETLYRGYLFERLGKLLGRSAGAKVTIVMLTSLLFAAVHYPIQGLPGVQQSLIVGLVFGGIFAVTGSLWLPMVAHAAFDLAAVAIIYWNLETAIARLVFR